MAKHTQTIRRLLPKNCLSVFDHFLRLALKILSFLRSTALNLFKTRLQRLILIIFTILTGKNYRNNLIHEFVKTKSRLFFTPPIKVSYFNWACIYFNYEYRCLNNMIHWIDRKWTVVSFSKFYGETFVGSCHKAGNTYSQIYSLICTF